jgi:hypothetical protein
MKTPNAMLMAASMGSALFIVKVAVSDGEGDVGTGAYIAVTTVGLRNWVTRGEQRAWRCTAGTPNACVALSSGGKCVRRSEHRDRIYEEI